MFGFHLVLLPLRMWGGFVSKGDRAHTQTPLHANWLPFPISGTRLINHGYRKYIVVSWVYYRKVAMISKDYNFYLRAETITSCARLERKIAKRKAILISASRHYISISRMYKVTIYFQYVNTSGPAKRFNTLTL